MTVGIDTGGSHVKLQTAFWVAVCSVCFLAPFSIVNFINLNYPLAYGAALISAALVLQAWLSYRKRYYPLLTLLGVVPVILMELFFAYQTKGMIGALWSYPAIITFYFLLPERSAWLANAALLMVAIPCSFIYIDLEMANRVVATLVCVSVFSIIFLKTISLQNAQLREMAVTDPLTGLANRLQFNDTLEQAYQAFERKLEPVCLVMLDIDLFKQINDQYGHAVGDKVLQELGQLLKDRIRRSDRIFRMGGEEFVIILYDTELAQATGVAETLMADVAKLNIIPDQQISMSAGIAECVSGEGANQWLKRSDDNLYQAKQQGRNQVVS